MVSRLPATVAAGHAPSFADPHRRGPPLGRCRGLQRVAADGSCQRVALIQHALTDPGTRWHYSSPGYLLAGHIVARASGQPYAGFLTEQVLVPLGLTSTSASGLSAGAAAARGYRNGQPVTPWPLDVMPGTGDICSTVGDLARFTAAVHSGSLIRQQRFAQAMITPHVPLPDGQGTSDGWVTCDGYGYGQFIGQYRRAHRLLSPR